MVKRTIRCDARRASLQGHWAIWLAGAIMSGQAGATVTIPEQAKIAASVTSPSIDILLPPLPDASMPSRNQPIFGAAPQLMPKPAGFSTKMVDLGTVAVFGREYAVTSEDDPSVRSRIFKAIFSDRLFGRIALGGGILIFAVVFFRRHHRRRISWGVIPDRSTRPYSLPKRQG